MKGMREPNASVIMRWRRAVTNGPLRGVLALTTGTAGAQALTVLAAPVLTRLYPPESFGIFSYMVSVTLIIGSVASFKLESAIPLANNLSDAQKLTRMAILATTCTASLAAVVVAVCPEALSRAANFNVLPWALWVPFLVLLTGLFVVLSQAALRERAYTVLATRTLTQNVGTVLGQFLFATVTRTAGGLLTGQLLGRMFGILSLARKNSELLRRPGHRGYRATLRSYWRFPVVFGPSALLNTLGTQLPLILVGAWFGVQAAGFLGVAQRIVMIPAAIIGVAVGQVFAGELSARLRASAHDNRRLYLRASGHLAILGSAITVALLTLPPWLFPILLGTNWAVAGAYAQATAFSTGLGFIASPVSFVFLAYQRTLFSIIVDVSRLILVCGLGYFAYRNGWTAVSTVWMMYAGQSVNYVLTWMVGLVIASDRRRSPTGTTYK